MQMSYSQNTIITSSGILKHIFMYKLCIFDKRQ